MIEDPKLTLQVLEHFAQDEIGYPANLTINDLYEAFPNIARSRIDYHVVVAIEAGLLDGTFRKNPTYQGVQLTFGSLVGLTGAGSDYVTHARSKNWQVAWDAISKTGFAVTTALLVETLKKHMGGE